MPDIRIAEGPHAGDTYPLDRQKSVMGRDPECDVVFDSLSVSRQHAQIEQAEGEFFIEDLQSRNGTYVNSERIRQRHRLSDDDRITLCDVVLVFHDERNPSSPGHGTAVGIKTVVGHGADLQPAADAVLVDDEPAESSSTVMQRLNIAGGTSSLRIEQNPQAKLKAVLEISRSLGRALSLHDVLPKVLDGLMTIFPHGDRGVIVLRDGPSGKLVPRALKHRRPELVDTVRVSRTIVQGVMASKEAILSADAASDKRFAASESIVDFHIRSVMCAPLVNSVGDVLGVIQIDTADPRNRFNLDDLDVLASVACQAAIAVENAELHEMAVRDQRRSRELELAHDVLRGILPKAPARIEGYEFFDFYEPALELGGDYYDYIPLPGKRLAVVVADVSGKGVPASLLVARLSADVRNCLANEPTPAEAVARTKPRLHGRRLGRPLRDAVAGGARSRTHELTLVDAGHPPAYLCQNREFTPLKDQDGGQTNELFRWDRGRLIEAVNEADMGLPLGVTDNAEYRQVSYKVEPGDWLAMYTDGFSEATNGQNELYGLKRLQKQMGVPSGGVAAQGRSILRSVKEFVGDRAQSDDMCLVCLGRVK